jgi:CRISPR-associated protein Cmr4
MNDQALLYLYTDGPVHPGGSSSRGEVDLPIQREATTTLPVIWGQSLKGALRDQARTSGWKGSDLIEVFGDEPPEKSGGTLTPGSVSFGDARLVAFPAPATQNTFAWLTSPLLLGRLQRLHALAGNELAFPGLPANDEEYVGGEAWSDRIGLGDYILKAAEGEAIGQFAEKLAEAALPAAFKWLIGKFKRDLLVVGDGVLVDCARDYAEVVHRVQLKADSKNVAEGPWVEEYLPAETLLVAHLQMLDEAEAGNTLQKLMSLLDNKATRIGGDESVGKGIVWCRIESGGAKGKSGGKTHEA